MWEMAGVAYSHLKAVYSVMQNSLQQEWSFLKGITPDMRNVFLQVEEDLWEGFIMELS